MGWPDIRKINSDFLNEPLNFNNYINDISTFGKYSYALDAENENLWLSLISQSLTLFGHDAIHDTVYERFTDDEVDYMIERNARLGQSFNSFYSIDDFASGPVDAVLKSITIVAYNKLDIKFQNGINRYISAYTRENAGAWLTSVFDIDMSGYQTMDDLLADTAFWTNTVESNESLRFVISLSVSSAEYMASHTDSSIYVSFIETVAQSTDATMTLINALAATAQIDTFFANESVCTAIANSAPSMTAICYNTDGFAAMIASETAMNIVAASETAVNVIIEGITNATNSETVLEGIKGNLTSIEESLPSIANTETVIAEVGDCNDVITDTVTSLQRVTSQADILILNIDALFSNETALNALFSNETALNALFSNETALNALFSNETAFTNAIEYDNVRNSLYNNAEITEPLLAASPTALEVMKNSERSELLRTTSNSYNAFSTIYQGKAFVLYIQGYADVGYGRQTYGNFIIGNEKLIYPVTTNTVNVNKFASSVIMTQDLHTTGHGKAYILKI